MYIIKKKNDKQCFRPLWYNKNSHVQFLLSYDKSAQVFCSPATFHGWLI